MLLRISFSQQRKRSEGAAKMHRLKPERDGRASLLAFIAALDASARRDGCGDHTINARVLGQGVNKSLRTVHDEIGAAVGLRLYRTRRDVGEASQADG